jgi:hypothetical protein
LTALRVWEVALNGAQPIFSEIETSHFGGEGNLGAKITLNLFKKARSAFLFYKFYKFRALKPLIYKA